MSLSAFSAPSSEFHRIKDLLSKHHATYIDRTHYRAGQVNALAQAEAEKGGEKNNPNNKVAAATTAGASIRLL